MTRYFKKSLKNGRSYQNNTENNHSHKSEDNSNNPDKHVPRTYSNADQVNDNGIQKFSVLAACCLIVLLFEAFYTTY